MKAIAYCTNPRTFYTFYRGHVKTSKPIAFASARAVVVRITLRRLHFLYRRRKILMGLLCRETSLLQPFNFCDLLLTGLLRREFSSVRSSKRRPVPGIIRLPEDIFGA